jgi:hypothetical protein
MKKTSLKTALLICLVTAMSCNKPTAESAAITDTNGNHPRCGSVITPLDTAINCIHRYDSVWTALFRTGEPPIKAYTIRAEDLLEAMGMPASYAADTTICKYNHVRVYIGLDAKYKFKLFFTPVTGADLCQSNGGTDKILYDSTAAMPFQYVLDLNAPCPNTCGSGGSPLY